METSTLKETSGISGRPLRMVRAHGTGYWPVETQKSTGTTAIYDKDFLFVAFWINKAGRRDGVEYLFLCPFDSLKNDNRPLPSWGWPIFVFIGRVGRTHGAIAFWM